MTKLETYIAHKLTEKYIGELVKSLNGPAKALYSTPCNWNPDKSHSTREKRILRHQFLGFGKSTMEIVPEYSQDKKIYTNKLYQIVFRVPEKYLNKIIIPIFDTTKNNNPKIVYD